MEIKAENLKSIVIKGDNLTISYCGDIDKTSISKITLKVKVEVIETQEQFTYL